MSTQKHMGRGSLIKRLTAQVGSEKEAIAILKKRGHMDDEGKLTAKGRERDRMTAEERAKDRASKVSGRSASAYTFSPKTNSARLK